MEPFSTDRLPEPTRTILYLMEEEDRPELLLFDENIVRDPRWKRASKKLWGKLKERYEQLAMESFAVDRFVRRFRSFKKVTVLLSRPIEPAEVKTRLKRILRERSYHHLRWLIIDALLLPVSLFVMIIPGPNFWGYYLLFRVYSHWKSYRAGVGANLESVDVEVSAKASELSAFVKTKKDVRGALQELRRKYGLRALQEHHFIPEITHIKNAWQSFRHRPQSTE